MKEQRNMESWKCLEHPPENAEKYHYTGCGLDNIYLVNGFTHQPSNYGAGVTVNDVDGLHRAIGENLATNKKELSGKELRFLRKEMDLTQAELGRFIGFSSQQVARWEKSQSPIAQPADYLVRKLYLEHIDGEVSLIDLVKKLDEHDACDADENIFEAFEGHWKAA